MKFKRPERIVNFDMDGTLVDFEYPIKKALKELNIPYADPTLDFYIAKRYQDPEIIELIEDIQNSKGHFSSLPLIDGAKELGWDQALEQGYHPRICTKPLRSNPYCIDEKKETIDRYFGPKAVDEAYIGGYKEEEPGIALIDDRPGLTNGKTWRRIIYAQPWNRHETGARLESWHDPSFLKIIGDCAVRYRNLYL